MCGERIALPSLLQLAADKVLPKACVRIRRRFEGWGPIQPSGVEVLHLHQMPNPSLRSKLRARVILRSYLNHGKMSF